jgi:hypothetical protein
MWLTLLAGRDLFTQECIHRDLERRRTELLGENPTPLKREIVERIIACWLRASYLELEFSRASGKERTSLGKLLAAAERDHLASVRMPTELQKPVSRHRVAKIPTLNRADLDSATKKGMDFCITH